FPLSRCQQLLHPSPTRRSSDLNQVDLDGVLRHQVALLRGRVDALPNEFFSEKTDEEIALYLSKEHALEPLSVDFAAAKPSVQETDRKSTRLNSSHQIISYAVFC